MTDIDLDQLAEELSDFDTPENPVGRSPREERVIAGFEDILRFAKARGRVPQHGEERDIFERLYAVRLDRLRVLEEYRALLEPLDRQGLLTHRSRSSPVEEAAINEDMLAAELAELSVGTTSITELQHVRPSAERRIAEEIAKRQPCNDFACFKPLFEQIQNDLGTGIRETRPFEMKADIKPGRFFIVGGQKAYVAERGEVFTNAQGRTDARLRVIFDNGTQSNLLMRSLQRALNKDEVGRRITEPHPGPLFDQAIQEGHEASGIIYVLRSKSDHPGIAEKRHLIHKIGVTNLDIEQRIAGARLQPTFLMADVEVVATYKLYGINRTKLENLIHRIFATARINIKIKDRFGNPVVPREWFLVPLHVIDDAVEKIRDKTITQYRYDTEAATFIRHKTE